MLFAVGVNHKTAPIEAREKLYVHESEILELSRILKQTLSECLVLSTCNRTEIYGVINSADNNTDLDYYKNLLIEFKNAGEFASTEHFFSFVSCAACRQLFEVATSLDSKIVGDMQILQQFKSAYVSANDADATGRVLNQLSQRALKIGKKVNAETAIHKGAVSVSLAAVELAAETLGSLEDKNIMIVGAGETARLTAECLLKRSIGKILITNRTNAKAIELMESLQKDHEFDGETIRFEDFKKHLDQTDILISSTGASEPVLRKKDFRDQTNKILLIDIAIPRDIEADAAENEFVVLKNIDDLHQIVDRNYERRMSDLPRVKKIVMKEMGEFLAWYYSLPLLPEMEKTGAKNRGENVKEVLRIREFLLKNASEFHKLARETNGDAANDLKNHFALVEKLQTMKREAFGDANV